jgi:tetratricopeptide (TPR) repeat protein
LPAQPCPDENQLAELLEGTLEPAALEAAQAHLDECGACRRLLAELMGGGDRAPLLKAGATFGRYRVIELVGVGAMGVVYAAHDPQLDRRVALKLLRRENATAEEPPEAWLLREAQVLARLAHPNVVAVHEVSTFAGQLYVAMELVDGWTLAEWLRAAPRSRHDILAVFRQAGEGLAAAHAAGVVHRDFKPDNVLVGRDGRARVTDFGLARELQRPSTDAVPRLGMAGQIHTTARGLVGTPAYMAKEQLEGKKADARSDQFAFSVALYEALLGVRPFAGPSPEQLLEAIERRELRPPARGRRVPGALRRVLVRGLSPDPEQRYEDMKALLTALERAAAQPRKLALAAGAVALLGCAAAFALWQRADVGCDAKAAWGDLWSDAQRAKVRAAFGQSTGAGAAGELDRAFAEYRKQWMEAHEATCRVARTQGTTSEGALARLSCLLAGRREAEVIAGVLGSTKGLLPEAVLSVAGRLPSVAECREGRVRARPPRDQDPARRAFAEHLRAHLAEASTLRAIGRQRDALHLYEAVQKDAEASGEREMAARAITGVAQILGDTPRALELARTAAAAGIELGDDEVAIDAWGVLANDIGFLEGKSAEGRAWIDLALAAVRRLGGDDMREAGLLWTLATIEVLIEGKYDEARPHLERRRQLLKRALGPGYWSLQGPDGLEAMILALSERHEEALPMFRALVENNRKYLGPDSMQVALVLVNMTESLLALTRTKEALATIDQALAIYQRNGVAFAYLAYANRQKARGLRQANDFAGALALDRAARQALPEGDESQAAAYILRAEGMDLVGLKRFAEAVRPLERAIELLERSRAPAGEIGDAHLALASALWDSGGDRATALRMGETAAAEFEPGAKKYGGAYTVRFNDARAWLQAHGGGRLLAAPSPAGK